MKRGIEMKKDIIYSDIQVKDCDIPDSLQNNIDNAFVMLRYQQVRQTKRSLRRRRLPRKTAVILIAVCVLLVGAVTVYAAVNHFWSNLSQKLIEADESQQLLLESRDRVDFLHEDESLSVSSNGITIKPLELILDKYNARMTFIVYGNERINSCSQIGFEFVEDYMDNPEYSGAAGIQYIKDKIIDPEGKEGFGFIIRDDDLSRAGKSFEGKTIHLTLKNLYGIAPGDGLIEIGGTWQLDIKMPEHIDMLTYEIDSKIGNSGYRWSDLELSELSLKANFLIDTELPDDTVLTQVPRINAVRLTDGTIISCETTIVTEDGKLTHELQGGPSQYVYYNGLPHLPLEEIGTKDPVGGMSTALFHEVADPYDIVAIEIVTVEEDITPDTVGEKTHYYWFDLK